MLKRILLPIFLLAAFNAGAQLNNSWIDYGKTYYKFRLAKDTVCRISQPVLAAAGLSNVQAQDLQLWRNGEEVRLYTSVASGTMSSSDFIEFFGKMNDGKPDKQLYRNPDFQLADRYSLETDTVSYFLTVNPGGANLRYTDAANLPPGTLTPDPYFMRSIEMHYRNQMNRGLANVVGEYVYSSSYDQGEGWMSPNIAPCCALTQEFTGLNVYTTGPANGLSIRVNVAGNAPNGRNVQVQVYDNQVYSEGMPFFEYKRINLSNLPISLLASPNQVPIRVKSANTVSTDRVVVASIGITYPARFIFNNQKIFHFDLAPTASGNYLVIDNFNYGSVAPVLFDHVNGLRYTGDISTAGKVKFVLPPHANGNRNLTLVTQEPGNVHLVNELTPRNFTNFANSSHHADYLIISHPLLFNDGNGNNYVEQYRSYRASLNGGSFNSKIYDINELVDQFAFGIKNHPGSIRDFVRFAIQNFSEHPKYVFLMGRGINYIDHRQNENNPLTYRMDLVPTFGWPASDVLLVAQPGTTTPLVPVGRLSAINGNEVNNYLQKVIQYENAQRFPGSSVADRGWMKNVLHVAGGKDSAENVVFKQYMSQYEQIIEDTLFGGKVETFSKTSTGAVQQANSQRIQDLFAEGLGFIGYFGHSSANTFEFNLSNPEIYSNAGKYPFFNVSGCSAGNFYIFDPLRVAGNYTLSEKYVLANQRGSIGFMADTHFGIPPFLNFYNVAFYNALSKTMYGNTVGNQVKHVIQQLGGNNPNLDYYTRIHLEEVALHGDPAIKINYSEKPDYVVEEPMIRVSPNIISVADVNFGVKVKMQNIGKAIDDSIFVTIKRKLPNDTVRTLFHDKVRGIRYSDSLELVVTINPVTDKGLNQIIVTLDSESEVDEMHETNNTVTKEFYVFEDELRPSYPYNFSIVNQQNITFIANTANPLSDMRQYNMEIDTTIHFNSPWKKAYTASGTGGVVMFTPTNLTFSNETVYYWRVSMVPVNSTQEIWNGFSFVYLNNSSKGFNQSHYYQQQANSFDNITLQPNRQYTFNRVERSLTFRTGLYPFYNYDRINVNRDFDQLEMYGCVYNSIQIYVFDSTTLTPWRNRNVSTTNGMYGSAKVCVNAAILPDTSRAFFEFPYNTAVSRKAAMDFLDMIPPGHYVAITNLGNKNASTSFIQQWKDDTLTLGSGNSLYHKLKSIGFSEIDSFTKHLPFLYFYQKGIPGYAPTQRVGPGDSSHIEQAFALNTTFTEGFIESAVYGPAVEWTDMHWRGHTIDAGPQTDSTVVEVWGVRADGSSERLATVVQALDTTLNFVDPQTYPYLKLRLVNMDAKNITPYQLDYFRINARMAPEGAVAPNLLFNIQDTVDQGQPVNFALAFKNISQEPFDSLVKVKFVITDRNNVPHVIDIPKRKSLVAGDTLVVSYSIPTENFPGMNTLFIEFNPDNDQPELYHYNNILYKDFFVRADKFNPLLDVTFDGVHILNRDIVSSKPFINIKLKDENRFMALQDTNLLTVKVRFPDGQTIRTYHFGDTMIFHPANLAAGNNTASIDFRPFFTEDGEYELIVSGRDAAGNNAGNIEYRVVFTVINKPMISNLLNYPNPFTTSTAFVFTLTGSQIPQNMRIQILTVTGKVVREITQNELGPIHIGRNITEFKWDGTDMYGQKLANGVYLYRVLTNLNGKSLDKFRAEGDNTDKYFNKGYGKMYLMR